MDRTLVARLLGLAFGGVAATAHAEVRQITGMTGYLSEWRFEVALADAASNDEFAGAVRWKHIGLCSANGPEEKSGEIKVQISHVGPSSRINAAISFEQIRCTYSGAYSTSVKGFMECSDKTSLPLALSFK